MIVTDHAVERYAERVFGILPGALTREERRTIRAFLVREAIDLVRAGATVGPVGELRGVIRDGVLITVVPPNRSGDRTMVHRPRGG